MRKGRVVVAVKVPFLGVTTGPFSVSQLQVCRTRQFNRAQLNRGMEWPHAGVTAALGRGGGVRGATLRLR